MWNWHHFQLFNFIKGRAGRLSGTRTRTGWVRKTRIKTQMWACEKTPALFVCRFSVWNVELFSLFIFWLLLDFSSGCDPGLHLIPQAQIKSVTKSTFYQVKNISSLSAIQVPPCPCPSVPSRPPPPMYLIPDFAVYGLLHIPHSRIVMGLFWTESQTSRPTNKHRWRHSLLGGGSRHNNPWRNIRPINLS